MIDRAQAALDLRRLGWNVVAAAPRGKTPLGQWKRWQNERVPERFTRESFPEGTENNVFVITGAISRLAVLDCDTPAADAYWRERLGDDILDSTACVPTGRGNHYYFRLAEGQVERGRSMHEGEIEWDLRAEGGGVIAPPSVHATGRVYEWAPGRGPAALKDAPAALFERVAGEPQEQPRSMLSHLLQHVPDEGGRNVWLAKVAGHYAVHIPHQDAYEAMVRDAAEKLVPPLPEHEIAKLIVSIWQTEQAKGGRVPEPVEEGDDWREALVEPTEDSGWLVSGGTRILTQIRKKVDDEWELALAPWCDSDLHVLGTVESEEGRVYEVELLRSNGQTAIASLPAKEVGSYQRLVVWLAQFGITIGPPDEIWPRRIPDHARLLRYLEIQALRAPTLEAVPYLGWHDETRAFVTHDGIIRQDGPAEFETVRPHPSMRNWAKYRYGSEAGVEVARATLSRVLEFHEETVAAVFGAWWAASLLKPQIQRSVSQFPFMALEAASESGKTTGYFNLMMQLSGHHGGQSNPTVAALRDALSSNRSGIVWVDDLDDLEHHGELLRQVTVGGSLVKKGEDNHSQITAQMRASLVISGEGLGLHGQKALMDRAILLQVPSPVGRLNRDGRPQWEDILDLNKQTPDLTTLAGSVVQLILAEEEQIKDIKSLRHGTGRLADKNAIIRLGARLLAAVTRENWMVELADDWVLSVVDHGAENALTLDFLPEVLRSTGRRNRPEGPDEMRRLVATPAFIVDGVVWFSPTLVSDWLRQHRRASTRLGTREALEDQARALGLGGRLGDARKPFRFSTGDGKAVYWSCGPELSGAIVARSEGEDTVARPEAAEPTQEELS